MRGPRYSEVAMQVPLEIRYHHLDRSESLDAEIRTHVDKLDRLYDRLVACHVAVEGRRQQHRTGHPCEIHIELTVPGQKLVVSKEPHKSNETHHNPDLRQVLKDAFHAAERQLIDFKRKQRIETKPFGASMHGSIAQILPDQDHGFILTAGGASLYFNRASMTSDSFDALKMGDNVHYIERDADNGPIAGKVWLATAEEASE
jgi:ribosome-associated translation inhibitor RaiA